MNLKTAARWVALAPLFVIPFLALYVSDSLYFPFITGKNFAFRIIVEIGFAAWVVLALADKKYRPQFSWTLALFGAFTLWMFVADALAESPLKAFWSNLERMDGWVTLIHLFAFFLMAGSVLAADKLWKNWWLTFLASSALISFYGVFQLLGVFQIHQGGVRLDATLGNSEYFAAYLLFAIAIALWQAIEAKGWLRYTLYALAALHVLMLFFTATRGAILGAIGAAVLGSILWMFEAGKKGRRNAGIVLVAIVVIVGGFLLVRHSAWVEKDPTLGRFATISLADGQTRFTIWHMAWEGFLARPVTGWGQEGFNYIFNTYYDPSLYAQEPWFDRAHNVFLDWLTAGGLPALLLFLALLGSTVVAFYRRSVTRTERVLLISVMAAYAFQGFFVFDNLFSYIPLAALFALAHSGSARPWKRFESLPAVSKASVGTIVTPIAIIAGVLVVWFVNVPNIRAAHELIVALTPSSDVNTNLAAFKATLADHSFADQEIREQIATFSTQVATAASVPDDAKTAVVSYAITQMGAEAAERPKDARVLLEYSIALRAAGDLPDALKVVDAALALSPTKQEILIQKGTIEWQLNDAASAAADFNSAYALAPGYDDAATYAAVGDITTGDAAAGENLLVEHFGTTTVDSDVLVYAYYQAKQYDAIIPLLELRNRTAPSADAAYRLASAYVLVGRVSDARATILAAISAYPASASDGQQLLSQLGGQ